MNITELFGLYYLGKDKPKDYIKWAEKQLLAGSDSLNMTLLASADFEKPIDTREVMAYFKECLRELNLEWPDEKTSLA